MNLRSLIGNPKLENKPYEVLDRGGHFVGRYAKQSEAERIAAECDGNIKVSLLNGDPVLLICVPPPNSENFSQLLHDSNDWDSARRF